MSLAQRFERRLEGVVGSAFARVFKGQVEPVEIGRALQREADDKRAVMANGQVFAPNRYRVSLGTSDHERLSPWDAQLCNSLAELVQEHLDDKHWATVGDIEVILHRDDSLHTGVFGVASRMEAAAPPRVRPYDSLSLPVVPGQAPGLYAQPFGSPPEQGAHAGGRLPAASPPPVPPMPVPPMPVPPMPLPAAPIPQYFEPYPPLTPPTTADPVPEPDVRALITLDGSEDRLALRRGSNVIGRGHGSDLQLADQGVSRKHLDVQFDGRSAVAYDLGSTNGTSVNGHSVGSHHLQHGDVLRVGHSRLVYHEDNS